MSKFYSVWCFRCFQPEAFALSETSCTAPLTRQPVFRTLERFCKTPTRTCFHCFLMQVMEPEFHVFWALYVPFTPCVAWSFSETIRGSPERRSFHTHLVYHQKFCAGISDPASIRVVLTSRSKNWEPWGCILPLFGSRNGGGLSRSFYTNCSKSFTFVDVIDSFGALPSTSFSSILLFNPHLQNPRRSYNAPDV